MTSPKELYKTLSADFESQRNFHFTERGKGNSDIEEFRMVWNA